MRTPIAHVEGVKDSELAFVGPCGDRALEDTDIDRLLCQVRANMI